MNKNILILLFFFGLISCEKPSECIESTGDIITKDVTVTPFTRVEVHRGIAVEITQGTDYKVQIKTGSNLMDNIKVTQSGNSLILEDKTTCNWLREYGQTTVYITAPNIEEIYSKTERNISSNGVLNYNSLHFISLDTNGDHLEGAGTGDFIFQMNVNQLTVDTNNVSRFFLSGTCQYAYLHFWAGDSRIEAPNLTAQIIDVYHRGSNDMIIKPIQSLTGTMNSTGNIILKNNPPVVNVQQLYQGHIIYN